MEASHRQLVALADGPRVVYGIHTGCGPLCEYVVPAAAAGRFQANLVRSHATGLGPPHPSPVARATMVARAALLARGCSGVRPVVVERLVGLLNAGVHPLIPEIGSVGASGDLVELAHVALALMGEGDVEWRGRRVPAAQALSAAGIARLVLEGKLLPK